MVGDVDTAAVEPVASLVTPVPAASARSPRPSCCATSSSRRAHDAGDGVRGARRAAARGRAAGARAPGPAQVLLARPRLRRLPHRPAPPRRRAARPELPLVPGTRSSAMAAERRRARLGVPWLGWTCGACRFCPSGRENLCDRARFTGHDLDGGYAEWAVADERFCFPIPDGYGDRRGAAALRRADRLPRAAHRRRRRRLGLYGFGAAAHIVAQVARWRGPARLRRSPATATPRRRRSRASSAPSGPARGEPPPEELDAAIIFAPAGALVPAALRAVAKGGTVVCAGIHMTDIPSFPYEILWGERVLRSVANLTRADGEALLALAPRVPVKATIEAFALADANEALAKLRAGDVEGALVVVP